VRGLLGTIATRATFAGLAVALLIGAGFEFFGVSVGPRLVDLSYSDTSVAWFYGLFAPAGLALGALLGGALSDRFGAVQGSALALTIMTALLAIIAFDDYMPGLLSMPMAWYSVAYFAIGLLTASSYALFMALSRGRYAATRISLFMAMTNACEAWAAFVGGRLAVQSYGFGLLVLAAVACLALLPLFVLRQSESRTRIV
jgi:PAT family beta-lactamase induction signal transducer AmpG